MNKKKDNNISSFENDLKSLQKILEDIEKDDLVMATLLVVRIVQQVAQYDENAYDELRDTFSDEDSVEPMPFVFLT